MNKTTIALMFICFSFFWGACSDDDEAHPPVTVNFTNQTAGISRTSPSAEIEITFSRPAAANGTLTLAVEAGDLNYGSENDYYTDPAAENGVIALPYEAGDEGLAFKIFSGAALNIQEDKSVTVSLQDVSNQLLNGTQASIDIAFSENFIARGGTIELDAGGAEFPQQAYIDLSRLQQTAVDKYSWDLGFYTEAGAFAVVLNSAAHTMARSIDKTDLATVTAEDTVSFGFEMQIPPPNYDPSVGAGAWIDSPDGNLEKTAFGAISATDSENKVFIVKRDGDQNWKKVRVLQNGDSYIIEYADINAASFESVEIAKDQAYNFIFFDLDNGIVPVEPAKDAWDLMYGTYTELLNLGGPGMNIPYGYKDYIVINRHDTKVAMVMIEAIAYEAFSTTDIETLEFSTAVNAMGAEWRSGGGPSSGPALYDDRYFVIQDAEGSYFKLKFTRLTATNGERGYPEFLFQKVE